MRKVRRFILFLAAAAALSQPFAALAQEDTSRAEIDGLKSKFIDVDGVRVRYYDEGQGEPLLVIPSGFTAGSSGINIFSHNIHVLAKKYRVLAVDRLASGLTDNPKDDSDYSFQGDARFYYQFIKKMNLGRVDVVGLSAGNSIGLILAADHPEVVKLLIISSKGPLNGGTGTKLTEDLKQCPPDETTYEHMKCRMGLLPTKSTTLDDEFLKADAYMANLPKAVEARAKIKAGAGEPERTKDFPAYRKQFWDRLKNGEIIKMPVLLFAGKQDLLDWDKGEPSANLRYALFLHDLLTSKNPNVKFIVYNQAGHYLWREQPEQFNADVSTFIDYWNSKGLK